MLRSRGPNIEPWGTPEIISFHILKLLLARTGLKGLKGLKAKGLWQVYEHGIKNTSIKSDFSNFQAHKLNKIGCCCFSCNL